MQTFEKWEAQISLPHSADFTEISQTSQKAMVLHPHFLHESENLAEVSQHSRRSDDGLLRHQGNPGKVSSEDL
jgi:hypothetical protein